MLNNNKITGVDSGFQVRGGAIKKNCAELSLYLAFTNELNVAQKEKNIDE
jgi:hypothetical protein